MVLHPCTPRETIKLMDFGLAKMSSLLYIGADDLGNWSLPAASGTPQLVAPEQASGRDSDGRGDLYSVGVVLYEMLSGRRPFEQTTADAMLRAPHSGGSAPLRERSLAHVPVAVEEVVRRRVLGQASRPSPPRRRRAGPELRDCPRKAADHAVAKRLRTLPTEAAGERGTQSRVPGTPAAQHSGAGRGSPHASARL